MIASHGEKFRLSNTDEVYLPARPLHYHYLAEPRIINDFGEKK